MAFPRISQMRFAASMTSNPDAQSAVDELLAPLDRQVTLGMVDLVLLFSTAHFNEDLEKVVQKIEKVMPSAAVVGCTAEGTIGVDRELERKASISLLAATLPAVAVRPFHIRQKQLVAANTQSDWENMIGVSADSKPVFVAFGDPFSVDIHRFIEMLNSHYPDAPLVGGVASAAHQPKENRLICAGTIHRDGLVGVTLSGELKVKTVVSQGCRPIGKPFVITKADRNVIQELGGKPALEQLQNVLTSLSDEDEKLARQSMFLGKVIDEYKEQFTRGDFLIQNIVGADRKSGAIGIAGQAKVGATVQFHVRDAKSADEDLRAMLLPYAGKDIRGAMLFGCNGRGTHMWPEPGHDIGVLREVLGGVPTAGFFCGGEFGPVGKRNFVHGFTASIALFTEPPDHAAEAGQHNFSGDG